MLTFGGRRGLDLITTLRHPAVMQNRALKPRRAVRGLDSIPDFRLIADTVPHLVWTAGADGSIDFVNRRVFEYFGKRAAKLEGEGWKQLVHPQDWPYCRARWAQSLGSGEPYEIQFRLRRADGEYRWHLGAARALRSPAGRILKWVGTCTDIEDQIRAAQVIARRRDALERKVEQASQTLQEKEAQLRSIMTLSSDFYWETDAEHRFTVLEPGGRFRPIMFVATRLGKTRWEVPSVLPDADGWRAHRETLAARQAFREFETARMGDDGKVHHYSIDGEPVFGEQGEFRGYRGTGREISARKRAEQALNESDRRFRAFLDSMPAIAWIKDSRFRYSWFSASFSRSYGISLDEARGRPDADFWPGELARHFRGEDEKALSVNGPVHSVDSVPYSDGTMSRRLVVKFPLPDESGRMGVAGIAFDITDRVSHEPGDADAKAAHPLERLSARERQVLHLIVDGLTSAEVAARLSLSPKSIDTYRSRLMTKLGIEDLASLVKFAIRNGLTTTR